MARAQAADSEPKDGIISGTVLLKTGNHPASQVAVKLKSHAAGIFRSVLTDFEGHFEVRSLPPSTYEIVVEEPGYQPAEASTRVEGTTANLVLYLNPPSTAQSGQTAYTVSARQLKIPGKAQEEFKKGLQSLAKRDLAGSLGHFVKATQVFPDYYEAFYHVGLVETSMGKKAEAREAFQKSIDLSGGRYAWGELGIGYLLYLEGKTEEAVTIIQRSVERDGSSPDGHLILGMALLRLNRLDEAEKSAREALLRNPNFARAYILLADIYGRQHENRAQLQELDAYLKLEPNGEESPDVRKAREKVLGLIEKKQAEN